MSRPTPKALKLIEDDPLAIIVDGRRRCGAHVDHDDPRAPGRCMTAILFENGRCKNHGGLTPRGPDSVQWRGGREFRRYRLPPRILQTFNDAYNDPDLLSLRQDIALCESRIADLVTRVDTGESGAAWNALKAALSEYESAEFGSPEQRRAIGCMHQLIDGAVNDYNAWNELGEWQERKGRAQERERKRLVEMSQCLTYKEVIVLIAQTLDIIRSTVNDGNIMAQLSSRMGNLLGVKALPLPSGDKGEETE